MVPVLLCVIDDGKLQSNKMGGHQWIYVHNWILGKSISVNNIYVV